MILIFITNHFSENIFIDIIWYGLHSTWCLHLVATRDSRFMLRALFPVARSNRYQRSAGGTTAEQRRSLTSALINQHTSLVFSFCLFLACSLALSTSSEAYIQLSTSVFWNAKKRVPSDRERDNFKYFNYIGVNCNSQEGNAKEKDCIVEYFFLIKTIFQWG